MTSDANETTGVESSEFDGLTSRDAQLAALIATGKSFAEVAAEASVSVSTIARAARRIEFKQAVDALRGRLIEAGLGELCSAFAAAARELARLSRQGTPADNVKLGAARSLIDAVLKVRDQQELVRRIETLEQAANAARGT